MPGDFDDIIFLFITLYVSWGCCHTTSGSTKKRGHLAIFLLKEKIKPLQWIFFILAFIGVIMVKGFDPTVDFYGFTIILICAFFSAIVYLLISKIGKGDHPVVIVHYFMLIASLVGAIGCFFVWKTPVGIEWILLLSLGVVGFFAQIFMTKALQIGPAFQIAPFKYVEVVFSLLFGLLFFQELYNFYSLVDTLPTQVGVVDSTIEYATPNAVNLPDYLRVDLSFRYDFKIQSDLDASLSLSIWNLLNRTNVLNRFYSFDISDQIIERNSEALGLTPNLSFRLRL